MAFKLRQFSMIYNIPKLYIVKKSINSVSTNVQRPFLNEPHVGVESYFYQDQTHTANQNTSMPKMNIESIQTICINNM